MQACHQVLGGLNGTGTTWHGELQRRLYPWKENYFKHKCNKKTKKMNHTFFMVLCVFFGGGSNKNEKLGSHMFYHFACFFDGGSNSSLLLLRWRNFSGTFCVAILWRDGCIWFFRPPWFSGKWDVSKISSLNFLCFFFGSFPLNHDCGRNRRSIYVHFPLHVGKFHRSCIVNNPFVDPMGKANSWWTHLIPGCFRPALDQLASHVRQVGADLKRTPGDEKQLGMCRRCSSHPCVVSVYIYTIIYKHIYICVCVYVINTNVLVKF